MEQKLDIAKLQELGARLIAGEKDAPYNMGYEVGYKEGYEEGWQACLDSDYGDYDD